MNTLTNMETTIDAIKEVSSNALLKHGFSRQRIFDYQRHWIRLGKVTRLYMARHITKELVLFVITRSTNGLRYNTIARRSGLKKVVVHDCLTELLREQLIYKGLNDKKLLYCAKKITCIK